MLKNQKVLFIENRFKTKFWLKVSKNLEKKGLETFLLVQNKVFTQKNNKNICIIPKPLKNDLSKDINYLPDDLLQYLSRKDRGNKYFNSGTFHYGYYYQYIKSYLENLQPDLVVGESTLFHELITIYLCKKMDIQFIHPTGSRYPSGRFQLFKMDTQEVALSSNESWKKNEIDLYLEGIRSGHLRPDYMIKRSAFLELSRFTISRIFGWLTILRGRIDGDIYNTPSLFTKFKLAYKLKKHIKKWDRLSSLPQGKKNILYLMQMQPEANLDVWGSKFSDQVELIKKISSILPSNHNLIVKINPKTKYEVFNIFNINLKKNNVYLAPRDSSFNELLIKSIGILTVTGTIGIEGVFKSINCVSLNHPVIQDNFPSYSAKSIEQGVNLLLNKNCDLPSKTQSKDLLKILIANSFKGVIGDPIYSPDAFLPSNIDDVASAIIGLVER